MSSTILRSNTLANIKKIIPTERELVFADDILKTIINYDGLKIISQMFEAGDGHVFRDFDLNKRII